jgi:hypothetical protein
VFFLELLFLGKHLNPFKFNIYDIDKNSEISAFYTNTPISGRQFRVKVSSDGHLESNGKRLRIFGTNLTNIPLKTEAIKYAEFLASQGYNCVRFHHVDSSWANALMKLDQNTNKWVISKEGLDRFDYFVNELKKCGIYTNINLLTGRTYSSADGLPKNIDKVKDWKNRHCYGFWNETARNLQKEFAKELLGHTNPYTGLTYLEDPAVAIVEINNENGVIHSYLDGWLEEYDDELWGELEEKWNVWLKKNNHSFESLAKTYNQEVPISTELVNSNSRWNFEKYGGAEAKVLGTQGSYKIEIKKKGMESWHIQYNTSRLSLQEGNLYTVKFTARATNPAEIDVSLQQAHDPWMNAGWSKRVNLTPEWQTFEIPAVCGLTDSNIRLNFSNMGFLENTDVFLKEIAMYEGGSKEVVEKSAISAKNIKLPRRSEYDSLPNGFRNLVLNFLYSVEENYWSDMLSYIREDLGSKSLIMGTAVTCSTVSLMNMFDIIDSHAYWNHPVFPNESWNNSDYYVNNADLTKDATGGTLTNLALQRVYGKPFSVSEYDHPYPNQFSSQMYPMLASYASFQDWDCIYTFCSEIPTFAYSRVSGYFDQSNNPVKTAAAPIAARIFKNFLVEPAKTSVYVELDKTKELENLYRSNAWAVCSLSYMGIEPVIGFKHKFGIAYNENANSMPENAVSYDASKSEIDMIKQKIVDQKDGVFSDTKELFWNANYGVFIVQNPFVAISVLNKDAVLPTYPIEWIKKDMLLPIIQNKDFITFAAVKEQSDWLIFSSSWCGNKNESLHAYGAKENHTKMLKTRDAIPLSTNMNAKGEVFTLSGDGILGMKSGSRWKLYQFDNKGQLKDKPQLGTVFTFKQDSGTLWYKLSLQ